MATGITDTKVYDDFLTQTLDALKGEPVRDNVFKPSRALSWTDKFLKEPGGGARFGFTIKRDKPKDPAGATTFQRVVGLQPINVQRHELTTPGFFKPFQWADSMILPWDELRQNMADSKYKVADMLNTEWTAVKKNAVEQIASLILKGDTAIGFDGWDQIISDSTTVGGIAPGSFSVWKSALRTATNFSNVTTTNAPARMRELYSDLVDLGYNPTVLWLSTTAMLAWEAIFGNTETVYTDAEISKGAQKNLNVGFTGFTYKGRVTVMSDLFMPTSNSGVGFLIDPDCLKYKPVPDADFGDTPWFDTFPAMVLARAKIFFHQFANWTNCRRGLGRLQGTET